MLVLLVVVVWVLLISGVLVGDVVGEDRCDLKFVFVECYDMVV